VSVQAEQQAVRRARTRETFEESASRENKGNALPHCGMMKGRGMALQLLLAISGVLELLVGVLALSLAMTSYNMFAAIGGGTQSCGQSSSREGAP
jgi:small-conductance mechanosensitive channel